MTTEPLPPLGHDEVAEQQLADLYLLGRLSPDDAQRFEIHLIECVECQEHIEVGEVLVTGLRRAAAEDTAALIGHATGWLRYRRFLLAAAAVVPALLLLVLAGVQRAELRRLESRLTIDQGPAEGLYLPLAVRRSGPSQEPSHRVRLPSAGQLVLSLELEAPLASSYRVELLDSGGRVLWQGERLVPNAYDALVLTLPAAFLEPGDYRLVAEPVEGEGVGFGFRVLG
jgi:hypothetical protein